MRVEELEAGQPVMRRRRVGGCGRPPRSPLAAAVAAFVVLLAARGPVVEDVLAVGLRPATAPATLSRPFEGVRFPSYGKWRATGERTDVVDGRAVRTVFYERDGRVIAYAIVAGPALAEDGSLRVMRDGEQVAVTWTRRWADVRDRRGWAATPTRWLDWPSGSAGELRLGGKLGTDRALCRLTGLSAWRTHDRSAVSLSGSAVQTDHSSRVLVCSLHGNKPDNRAPIVEFSPSEVEKATFEPREPRSRLPQCRS